MDLDVTTLQRDPAGRAGHLYDPETQTVYHVGADVLAQYNAQHPQDPARPVPGQKKTPKPAAATGQETAESPEAKQS